MSIGHVADQTASWLTPSGCTSAEASWRPERRPSGYRMYTAAAVDRVRLVKQLRGVGFTLREVSDAMRPFDAGTVTCEGERWRVQSVPDRVDAQMAEWSQLRHKIVQTLDQCQGNSCPHIGMSPGSS